ncbi:hypothetical protein HW532_09510 [Kaustia mangrovi]|uniref:Hydantoin racemase n=1 Tax=Kaustia mangrovi TaxID=2593653 RepID=A0A7S8C418_9HYPH|nr:aspartate/glutamate racemase family protein [Kaustia mangrovi]QPC42904.1 hypothetical protein HW532_09510 [Kaustia mangrovi]
MRIKWVHPTSPAPVMRPLWERMEAAQTAIARPDLTLEFAFPALSANFGRSFYAEHLNAVGMVEAALAAEAEGCDGVVLGCWNDPLWQAREVLGIPVASVGEQTMLAALAMGARFAVVTVADKVAPASRPTSMPTGLPPGPLRAPSARSNRRPTPISSSRRSTIPTRPSSPASRRWRGPASTTVRR